MRSQSLVSVFDTIRVVHSQYIEDTPTLRNPPSDHPRDYSVISPKPAGIVPSSARAPGARGGLAKPGASCGTGNQHRSNIHAHPPARPFFRPSPTAPSTAPGRFSDARFRSNGTFDHASAPTAPEGKKKNSECHLGKWLRAPKSGKALNQEVHTFRFDSSWTDP